MYVNVEMKQFDAGSLQTSWNGMYNINETSLFMKLKKLSKNFI